MTTKYTRILHPDPGVKDESGFYRENKLDPNFQKKNIPGAGSVTPLACSRLYGCSQGRRLSM